MTAAGTSPSGVSAETTGRATATGRATTTTTPDDAGRGIAPLMRPAAVSPAGRGDVSASGAGPQRLASAEIPGLPAGHYPAGHDGVSPEQLGPAGGDIGRATFSGRAVLLPVSRCFGCDDQFVPARIGALTCGSCTP